MIKENGKTTPKDALVTVKSSVVEKAESIKMVVKQTNEQGDRAIEQRKDSALAMNAAGWGLPQIKEARQALMAITAYYGLDPVMGDIILMGGKTLYITEQAYKKKLDEISVANYGGKPWRWVKRPATKEEVEVQGYADRINPRLWYVELYLPEGHGEKMVSCAFGEADRHNMTLQNVTKQSGDPRVLNRMAIKRAQHECMRDVVVFRLPAPADFERKMGMAMEKMLESGIGVVLDDGIIPTAHLQDEAEANAFPAGPTPKDVIDGTVTEPEKDEKRADGGLTCGGEPIYDEPAKEAVEQTEPEPETETKEAEPEPETQEQPNPKPGDRDAREWF